MKKITALKPVNRISRYRITWCLILLYVFAGHHSLVLASDASFNNGARPKIGLVLAGGGAKGGAHVGVLKILEEMNIPIDYVAGTSMGSIVGGLYASGYTPDEIEKEIQAIDWVDVFEDNPSRQDRSFRRKQDDKLFMFKAKPGLKDGKLIIPLAYIHGQKFDLELNRLTQRVSGIRDFDDLPIPFRAVAADLETGKEVVLGSGNLSRALRASMAVPGAFDPVLIDDQLLVDGGIANNIPVSVARDMGADIVIVSDLGSDLFTRDQITSGLAVAAQMVNFLFARNSQEALSSLGPRDVLITTDLGDIGSASFDRIQDAVVLGEKSARATTASLARYTISGSGYRQHQAVRHQQSALAGPVVVNFIEIDNDSGVSDAVIASYLTMKMGQPLDVDLLEEEIQQIYGLELFKSVRYELIERQGEMGLLIIVRKKEIGPSYLQAGLITSMSPEGDTKFRAGLAYTRTQINSLNGEWRIGAQVGDESSVFAEIYQPLDVNGRYFVSAKAGYGNQNTNVFDTDGNKTAQLQSKRATLDIGFGRQFGTWGEARLGYLREWGESGVRIGPSAPDQDFKTAEFSIRLSDDKLDSLYFPTSGHYGVLEWIVSDESFGADTNYEQLNIGYHHAATWGDHTLIGGIDMSQTISGTAPLQSLNRLGGFLSLSGSEPDRYSGQHSALARAIYLHQLKDAQFFNTYVGASLELGNVWQDTDDISFDNSVAAGSLFIGADTPVGPLYLSYGANELGDQSVYLFLGPLFSF